MAEATIPTAVLGDLSSAVDGTIAQLRKNNIVERIWANDHTVWRKEPTGIADRLGWLTVLREMAAQVPNLVTFAKEIRDANFKQVVLLGMGGSSLGPEVIRQTFGSVGDYPRLIVLDSTAPSSVRAVSRQIDPRRALFIVSSKSGSTIEPNSFYKYFRKLVEDKVGETDAGSHFVAITDPGTSLTKLADRAGFRKTFENPPDIGGRYSVLSFFGLVPAALSGVDVGRLLARAEMMANSSRGPLSLEQNSAAWLGAYLGAAAKAGRDKATLVMSPRIASFGLWVEQLLAESLGKEGKGIIPVVGEPLMSPDAYGDDRALIHVRVDSDENAEADVKTERLAAAGHPLVRLNLTEAYDLGAEFFRWEMATAVAGAILGVHPFDQPDVQSAKDATTRILNEYLDRGRLPSPPETLSLTDLLKTAKPGDYLAITAYAQQTPGVDRAAARLRQTVMERHKIATTMAYGPRFLHSTGQLHKGGPNTCLVLQLTVDDNDLDIPGEAYGFGTLLAAQAMGDCQALVERGRRVARVHIGSDAEAGILRLLAHI
jgi:glucose-6-phosphate isomerase/transaldolase/glucose-6-phosphate isomerase